jgi:hypothetical protein
VTSGINLVAGVLVGFSAPAALATPAWGWGIAVGVSLALIGAAVDYHRE